MTTVALTERRAKEYDRIPFEGFAFAFMAIEEWLPDVPWYPGSAPPDNEIRVSEHYGTVLRRVEAASLASADIVAAVVAWYSEQMPKLGWIINPEKSRLAQEGVPDHRWLTYHNESQTVEVRISVREPGKPLNIPWDRLPGPLKFLRQEMAESDARLLTQAPFARSEISLSRHQLYDSG